MAVIWLRHTSAIAIQANATRSWQLPSLGQAGTARFRIPLGSPAADPKYLSDTAGSYVFIPSEDDCGDWSGVITHLDWSADYVDVEAAQSWLILSYIPVDVERTYRNLSCGALAYFALKRAIGALGGYPLGLGGVAELPPFIDTYTFRGESVWSVLLDLMRRSGAEIGIRTFSASGEGPAVEHQNSIDLIDFGAAVKSRYPTLLLAPGQLANAQYALDITGQASTVTALDEGIWYTAIDGTSAGYSRWPAQVVVKEQVSSIHQLKALAEAELGSRRNPRITITGDVPRSYWNIREGDTVAVTIPWARFTGTTARCRVVSREVGADDEYMQLKLAFIAESGTEAIGTGWGGIGRERSLSELARLLHSGTLYQGWR